MVIEKENYKEEQDCYIRIYFDYLLQSSAMQIGAAS